MGLLRKVLAYVCMFVYRVIAWVYELFINISRVEILNARDIKPIYQRVTLILSIIMLFYIIFEFVKFVVQPDGLVDKEKGAQKTVFKMVIVVILIAFVPNIFSWGYKLQNVIFDNQLFSKIILGKQDVEMSNIGRDFSANMLSMFYYIDKNIDWHDDNDGTDCGELGCEQIVSLNLDYHRKNGALPYLTMGLDEEGKAIDPKTGEKVDEFKINFDGLFAVGVGIFVGYMLILYCIDAGARVVQLMFLQIIAPIPIIGYLSPKKDGIFQKWVQQCVTTYLDLFFRVGVMYFVILIAQILTSAVTDGTIMENATTQSDTMKTFMFVAIIMGLLMFAKKAPDMIKELFPKKSAASGNLGLGWKNRGIPQLGRVLGGAVGGAAGALAGAATGVIHGARRAKALRENGEAKGFGAGLWGATKGMVRGSLGGATRGIYNGAKKGNIFKNAAAGIKNQTQANQRFGNREENGYTLGHQIGDRTRGAFGLSSRIQNLEKAKAPITQENETLKKINDTRKQIEDRALSKLKEKGGKNSVKAQEYDRETQRLKDLQENQTVRSQEFRVGKYKHTDAAKAITAYENDVALAKASVNKSNFMDPTGKFDAIGYKKACDAAVAKIKVDDYTIAYRTKADAAAAVEAAGIAKGINRTMFSSDDAYNQALLDAGINKDMYIAGFDTQEDADMALAEEINKQKKKVDEAKDAAVADYVANSGDGAIDSMIATLNTTVTEYNKTASVDRNITYNNGGDEEDIDADKIKSDFVAFSDMVKGSGSAAANRNNFNARQNRNEQELIEQNAEIARIKNETEGSGINEGKK